MRSARERTVAMIRARRALNLAGKPRRKAVPRPGSFAPLQRDYAAALLRLYARVRPAFAQLEAELPALLDSAARERRVDAERGDAGEGKRTKELIAAARERLAGVLPQHEIEALAAEFARRTSTHQRIALNKQVHAVFGVDPFITERWLPALMEHFVEANVGLIKGLTDDVAKRIEARVLQGIQAATPHGQLAKALDNEFALGEQRAKLIATDQIGKAYGQMAAARHREMGVEKFIWRTVHDQRVRGTPKSQGGLYPKAKPSHYLRDGVMYRYDDPPKGRNGEPELPGEPIRCRCFAEPVFDDLLGDL